VFQGEVDSVSGWWVVESSSCRAEAYILLVFGFTTKICTEFRYILARTGWKKRA